MEFEVYGCVEKFQAKVGSDSREDTTCGRKAGIGKLPATADKAIDPIKRVIARRLWHVF